MLTIGEVAKLADTTVRAVRHYHAIGLVAEPPRDHSGYRRYGAVELVRLLRVRRLRELGLSLERVAELLDGPEPTLLAALDALDAELAAQAERIAEQRARLAQLRAGNPDPELPEPIARLFARYADAGAPARAIQQEKEVLLLDLALHPGRADTIIAEYVELYRRFADNPQLAELGQAFDALADLAADDPAVEDVAQRFAAALGAELSPSDRGATHPRAGTVFQSWSGALPPAQRRVLDRVAALVDPAGDPRIRGLDAGPFTVPADVDDPLPDDVVREPIGHDRGTGP